MTKATQAMTLIEVIIYTALLTLLISMLTGYIYAEHTRTAKLFYEILDSQQN